ncbi:MAG: hypothetical protein O2973_09125 [Gemmatimonadetes bacterium]|nr:hypothetical protein [Gemmatimonadota bacterium]
MEFGLPREAAVCAAVPLLVPANNLSDTTEWSGYLQTAEYQETRRLFDAAGATFSQIHTSGHASTGDLEKFARRIAPRHLVPIHSFDWDAHLGRFPNGRRLRDGEAFPIP